MTVFIVQKLESPEKSPSVVFATLDDAITRVQAIHDSGHGSGAIGIFEVPIVRYDERGIIMEVGMTNATESTSTVETRGAKQS